MEILVNGKSRAIHDGQQLVALLEELGLHPRTVLVELNRKPLLKSDFEKCRLQDGDELEILKIAAGG